MVITAMFGPKIGRNLSIEARALQHARESPWMNHLASHK
jgi:hypothetical protein